MNDSSQKVTHRQNAILAAITVFFILLILIMVGISMGNVSGVEFSPDDFSRRSFSYTRLPWLKWTVSGKRYQELQPKLDLIGEGLITPQPVKNWHLVSEDQQITQPAESDARFLVDLLDLYCPKDFSNVWLKWNEKYPDLAKVFWPFIAELARDELYLAIPEFIEMALKVERQEQERDAVELTRDFENRLRMKLQATYRSHGKMDQELGRIERARYRLNKADSFK